MLQTIKHQDQGELVLVARALIGGEVRGSDVFDAEFVGKVCSWQRDHGLDPDGIIGPATWTKLADITPTVSTAKNRKGAYAYAVQLLVGADADGIIGPKSKASIASFQALHKLSADGICGPMTWHVLLVGDYEQYDHVKPKDYKQGASPWGPKMYSCCNNKKQTYSNSACGPTATADVIATLIDKAVTPYDMGQYALKRGDRTVSDGTAWSFFDHITELYPQLMLVKSTNIKTLKATLDAGGYVVCSMGEGYWTSGGHYICAWHYDGQSIYCNDPATSKRTKQNEKDFIKQRKKFFCLTLRDVQENKVNQLVDAIEGAIDNGIL